MATTSSKPARLIPLWFQSRHKTLISFGAGSQLESQAVILREQIVRLLTVETRVQVVVSPAVASASQQLKLNSLCQKLAKTFMMLKSSTEFTWVFQWAQQTLLEAQILIPVVLLVQNSRKPRWDLAIGTWYHHLTTTTGFQQEDLFAHQQLNAQEAKSVVWASILVTTNFCGKHAVTSLDSGPLTRFAVSVPSTVLLSTAPNPPLKV